MKFRVLSIVGSILFSSIAATSENTTVELSKTPEEDVYVQHFKSKYGLPSYYEFEIR